MKILHTSDWHLGRTLYGRRCTVEFKSFLDWMVAEIEKQKIECLLIAGDIFDSSTPSNTIQTLYYSFLHKVSQTGCRHVVIIGGNHDSPSLLNAPRQLLKHLNVTVIGSIQDNPEDEVITLTNHQSWPELIVCAVPFLRDRDVRRAQAGESIEDKARNLVEGIALHYEQIGEIASKQRKKLDHLVPIVAMGHLFTAGGKIAENNEVRDLYVGSLAHVHISNFPDCFDYLALGHLHIAQRVQQNESMRYSGSPLSLSFGKINQNKSVTVVEFGDLIPQISVITVPQFLKLKTLTGNFEEIIADLDILLLENKTNLLEVIYTGEYIANLQDELEKKIESSNLELLRTVNKEILDTSLVQNSPHETLEELDELDVFRRCLDTHKIKNSLRHELEFCFSEILQSLNDDGVEEQEL